MKKILFVLTVSLIYFLSIVIPKADAAASWGGITANASERVFTDSYTSTTVLNASYPDQVGLNSNGLTYDALRLKWTDAYKVTSITFASSNINNKLKISLYDSNGNVIYSFSSHTTNPQTLSGLNILGVRGALIEAVSNATVVSQLSITGTIQDSTPPDTPTNVVATPSNGSVTLTWHASTAPDTAGYNVYKNGTKVNGALVTGTTATYPATNNTNHSWQITAVDNAGNESEKTAPPLTTLFDTISPLAPIGLVSTPQGNGSTLLAWQANAEPDLAGYNAYQNSAKINGAIIPVNEYIVSGLQPNTSYSFQVTAADTSGNESPKSSAVTYFLDDIAPAIPTGLTVTAGNGGAALNWAANADPDVTRYRIYVNHVRSYTVNHPTTSFSVTGLTNGTAYTFSVTAEDATGNESAESAAVTATPMAPVVPAQPSSVLATVSSGKVKLSWQPVPPPVIKYIIYRDGVQVSEGTDTSYTDTAVTNGTLYSYEVSAVNAEGESTKNQVFAKPLDIADYSGISLPFNVPDMFKTAINFLMMYRSYILIALGIIFVPVLLAIVSHLLGYGEEKGKGKGKSRVTGIAKETKDEAGKERKSDRYAGMTKSEWEKFKADEIKRTNEYLSRKGISYKLDERAGGRADRASKKIQMQPQREQREGRERKKDGTWTAREKKRHQEKIQEHIRRTRSRTT